MAAAYSVLLLAIILIKYYHRPKRMSTLLIGSYKQLTLKSPSYNFMLVGEIERISNK